MKRPFILTSLVISAAALCMSLVPAGKASVNGSKLPCNSKSSYHFTGNLIMSMSTTMEGMDEPMVMKSKLYKSDEGRYMGFSMLEMAMLPGGMTMIIDTQDSIFLMMMELGGKKKGSCMDMKSDEFKKQMEKQKQDVPSYDKFKKTGNTKTILGYKCDEYSYSSEQGDMTMWITTELENWFKNYSGGFGSAAGVQMPEGMDGMWLGMTMKMKEQPGVVTAEITEINNAAPEDISTAGYTFEKR